MSIAIVNVSVPPDQLTFNRIELHVNNISKVYDMCEDNLDHTFSEMDNSEFENFLVISPATFNSNSYGNGDHAKFGFVFKNVSTAQGDVIVAKAFDVFGNVVMTSQVISASAIIANSDSEVIANCTSEVCIANSDSEVIANCTSEVCIANSDSEVIANCTSEVCIANSDSEVIANCNSEVCIANSDQNPEINYISQFVALTAGVTFMNFI